ncbi:uncharacterized protein ISCGN_029978 [Ixodes scapularis]
MSSCGGDVLFGWNSEVSCCDDSWRLKLFNVAHGGTLRYVLRLFSKGQEATWNRPHKRLKRPPAAVSASCVPRFISGNRLYRNHAEKPTWRADSEFRFVTIVIVKSHVTHWQHTQPVDIKAVGSNTMTDVPIPSQPTSFIVGPALKDAKINSTNRYVMMSFTMGSAGFRMPDSWKGGIVDVPLVHSLMLYPQTVRTTDFFSLHVQWANLENQVPPGVDTWDNIGTVNLKHLCRNRCMKQFVIFGNFKSHIVDTWQTVSKKWSFTLKFDKVACTTKSIDRSLRSNHGTALRLEM